MEQGSSTAVVERVAEQPESFHYGRCFGRVSRAARRKVPAVVYRKFNDFYDSLSQAQRGVVTNHKGMFFEAFRDGWFAFEQYIADLARDNLNAREPF